MIDKIKWRDEKVSRIILGTAQLGTPYGLSNALGQPNDSQAYQIISKALELGIDCFDTAPIYGDSEKLLGNIFKQFKQDVKVISKVFLLDLKSNDVDKNSDFVLKTLEQTLKDLQIEQLWGGIFHCYQNLEKWHYGIKQGLKKAKRKGLVKYIGISNYVYDRKVGVIDKNLHSMMHWGDIDIVQDACNAWDRRFMYGNMINHMQEVRDILCLIRSIYLQGLLLLSPDETDKKIPEAYYASKIWNEIAEELNITIKQLAFSFAVSLNVPLLIGVESVEQVVDNVEMYKKLKKHKKDIVPIIMDRMGPYLTPDIWYAIEMYGMKNYVWKGREENYNKKGNWVNE